MSSHGITYDELSQAISESYLHLSHDDTNEFTGTSMESREMTNEYDTTTLLKLARAIDEQQHRARNKGIDSQTDHMHESPINVNDKTQMRKEDRGETPTFISSHSTPLVSKQTDMRTKMKSRPRRRSTLSAVEEGQDEPSNDSVKGVSDRDVAVNELRQMIESLSLEELAEFKKPIETLITNHHRDKERKLDDHYVNHGGMYVTPNRPYVNSITSDSGSSGEDDDDSLSLTHTNTNSYLYKKTSGISNNKLDKDKGRYSAKNGQFKLPSPVMLTSPIQHHNNSNNFKKPFINKVNNERTGPSHEAEHEPDSAITTPPHSHEYTSTKIDSYNPHTINQSALSTSDHSYSGFSQESNSYIPRRAANKYRTKNTHENIAHISSPKITGNHDEQYRLEIEALKKENLNLQIKLNELEIKLSEKEAATDVDISSNDDSFVFNDTKEENANEKIDELTMANSQLNLQLSSSKNHMDELNNEIRYLKNKLTGFSSDEFNQKMELLNAQISTLQAQIGNPNNLITQDSILGDYKQFYTKLQLNHVDRLTKIEMSNLIKNLMLSLLITDFEHLPVVSSKIGKFFKIISLFMDQLHGMIYDDSSAAIRPSHYLKNHEYGMDELQNCLDGMLDTLLNPAHPPN